MPNINPNNEIEHINKEISLLQDRLQINEKSLNQSQNGLIRIKKIQVKQGQMTNFSLTKKIQKIFKDIFKNKIKHIEKKADLLKNALVNVQKRKRLFEKGLKKIAKMQNLSQNEFNQIAVYHKMSLKKSQKQEELKIIQR